MKKKSTIRKINLTIGLLFGLGCLSFAQTVKIDVEIKADQYILWVKNQLSCPYLLTAKAPSRNLKFEKFIPAHSDKILTRLSVDSVKKKSDLTDYFQYNVIIGDPKAIHDTTYNYLLPYPEGKFYRLIQGNHGKFTHNIQSSRFAFDFEMPVGSTVSAARGGQVAYTSDTNTEGGIDESFRDKGNLVKICHDDGTVGVYGHLKYKGVLVEVGEMVYAGQPIGFSGDTGYSSGPHLHFGVMAADRSIPIQFMNLPEKLEPHRYYKQVLDF